MFLKKVIVVTNQKGGIAKTTTSIHLAACAAKNGYKTLLVDVDPQANASIGVGVKPIDFDHGIADIFENPRIDIKSAIVKTNYENLYLLPSDQSLAKVEWEMWHNYKPEFSLILKNKLDELKDDFWVIIDTPPSLGIFTINALTAANWVVIPVAPDPYALVGLKYLSQTIEDIRYTTNKKLKVMGFLRTIWDDRSNLVKDIDSELNEMFPGKVFETAIRINVRLKEAAVAGMPVIEYDPKASSSEAYMQFYKEVEDCLCRQEEKEKQI